MDGLHMTPHGPWNIVSSRSVYRDPWIDVRIDDVIRPDRASGIHSIITLKPGVTALASTTPATSG